jgi:hypothetical protein
MTARPPSPPEPAEDIIGVVARHVRFELRPLKVVLAERLAEPDDVYIWPRAELIAGDVIDAEWPQELVGECERALAEAHEDFLVRAARCLEAAHDLEVDGRESRIGQAIRHRLAFDASCDVIAARCPCADEWCALDDGAGEVKAG